MTLFGFKTVILGFRPYMCHIFGFNQIIHLLVCITIKDQSLRHMQASFSARFSTILTIVVDLNVLNLGVSLSLSVTYQEYIGFNNCNDKL